MGRIQVIRQIEKQDKAVRMAQEITRTYKVLPYKEVEKRLAEKSTDFSLSRKNL